MAVGHFLLERALNDAGIGALRIADDAGFVDVFAGKAEVGGFWSNGRTFSTGTFATGAGNLAPLLRRDALIRRAAPCLP